MDEEESFTRLLSQSTPAPKPSLYPDTAADPWANPFASSPDPFAQPFASSSTAGLAASTSALPSLPAPALPSATYGSLDAYADAGFAAAPFAADAPAASSPREAVSPYVAKLASDADAGIGALPDPPSVIAAREAELYASASPFDSSPSGPGDGWVDPASRAFEPPAATVESPAASQLAASDAGQSRRLPEGLIDNDLLAESDPRASLTRAFVKSSSSAPRAAPPTPDKTPKAYVFRPAGKDAKDGKAGGAVKTEDAAGKRPEVASAVVDAPASSSAPSAGGHADAHEAPDEAQATTVAQAVAVDAGGSKANGLASTEPDGPSTPTLAAPDATVVPLPESTMATPTPTRPVSPRARSPAPPGIVSHAEASAEAPPDTAPSPAGAPTPLGDRVSVSPLDAPPADANGNGDYGFRALSIGGSSSSAEPAAAPSSARLPAVATTGASADTSERANPLGWDNGKLSRGWGEVEPSDDLFGAGGPAVRTPAALSAPLGGGGGWASDDVNGGWGGEAPPFTPSGPSRSDFYGRDDNDDAIGDDGRPAFGTPVAIAAAAIDAAAAASASGTPTSERPAMGTPRRSKLLSTPVFQVTVGDPTKIGDPVRGHVVYTVRTRTTSPHYRRGDMAVLRRFSDFLWLYEALTANNPGVVVPPVPDKHAFGRFQETFIETRRAALERCLAKITHHPVLQLDPDLRLFLESDSFAVEAKQRRLAQPVEREPGLLASWTGPKYVEGDDWFEPRRAYLDHLEAALRQLSRSLELASKARLDMALAMADFGSAAGALADADLGAAMSAALARLADLADRERGALEDQAKADVALLLNTADEYVRFIGSVRLAFASRIKAHQAWQAADKDVARQRQAREKLRAAGKLGDRANATMAEIAGAERHARDLAATFDAVTRLVKTEFARFERERVEEFKRTLERQIDAQIARQRELIEAWEAYHATVLKMVHKAQGQPQGQAAR